MKLADMVKKLDLDVKCGGDGLDADVRTGYASDLLSDVLANSCEGDIWITLQIHQNIVAVAAMRGLSGVVIINGREPEDETVKKAETENVPIMGSKLTAFELIGRLYALGISGMRNGNEGV